MQATWRAQRTTLHGHTESIAAVAVTPDGRWAVSGSWDKTLRVWDLESGAVLATLRGHSEAVRAVAVTPDGRRAVSGSRDKTLKVWDLESGAELATLRGHTGRGQCRGGDARRAAGVSGSGEGAEGVGHSGCTPFGPGG